MSLSVTSGLLIVLLVLLAMGAAVYISGKRARRYISQAVRISKYERRNNRYANLDKASELQDRLSNMAGYPVALEDFGVDMPLNGIEYDEDDGNPFA
jgi:CHASE3 domain sensor protein